MCPAHNGGESPVTLMRSIVGQLGLCRLSCWKATNNQLTKHLPITKLLTIGGLMQKAEIGNSVCWEGNIESAQEIDDILRALVEAREMKNYVEVIIILHGGIHDSLLVQKEEPLGIG